MTNEQVREIAEEIVDMVMDGITRDCTTDRVAKKLEEEFNKLEESYIDMMVFDEYEGNGVDSH